MNEKARILIIDDEPFNIEYLEQELEAQDVEILTATNGQLGLSIALNESPDLILLDIMMPVMDGFDVLRHLRNEITTRDMPVIIISALSDMSNVIKGIVLGAEDYLPKPFEPALLHARISSSLEKKRLRDLENEYLKSLERELEIGREIQKGFLPSSLPTIEGWDISSFFKSAKEVAGDFYDVFLLPGGTMAFHVGDVCGKGVGAALFMALFRSLISVTSTHGFDQNMEHKSIFSIENRLLQVLNFTNKYVTETHSENNLFATLFIGFIDPISGKVVYANCGNEPPMLIKTNGDIRELKPTGPVIGAFDEAKFQLGEIVIEKGQILLAFTDGITDAIDSNNISFGRDRLSKRLSLQQLTSDRLLKSISDDVNLFTRGVEQFDDITLLSIKRT